MIVVRLGAASSVGLGVSDFLGVGSLAVFAATSTGSDFLSLVVDDSAELVLAAPPEALGMMPHDK